MVASKTTRKRGIEAVKISRPKSNPRRSHLRGRSAETVIIPDKKSFRGFVDIEHKDISPKTFSGKVRSEQENKREDRKEEKRGEKREEKHDEGKEEKNEFRGDRRSPMDHIRKLHEEIERFTFRKREYSFRDYPLGLKFLTFFAASNALLFIFLAIGFPYILYFGLNLEGTGAVLLLLFSALMYVLVFSGIFFRKGWAVALSVFWYAINTLSSVVSLFFIDRTIMGVLYDFFVYGLILSSILNILVAWYIFHKRKFFLENSFEKEHFHRAHVSVVDKVFMLAVALFVVFSAVFGAVIGFNTLSKLSHSVTSYGAKLMEFNIAEDGIAYCNSSEDMDICLLTFSVLSQKNIQDNDLVVVCKDIKSPFLRYTCFEGLSVK